ARREALARQVADLGRHGETARAQASEAAKRAQTAKDELTRLQSEDLARERLLQRTSLEKRRAEFETEQATAGATLDRIRAAEAAAVRVQAIEKEGRALAKSLQDLEARHKDAARAVREAEEREAALQSTVHLIRWRTAREALAKAEAGIAQIAAWREEAARK